MAHACKTGRDTVGIGARRSTKVAVIVDKVEASGIAIHFQQQRFWLPWPLFGLAEAPAISRDGTAVLRWRMHCVDPESRPCDYHVGAHNTWQLKALKGGRLAPDKLDLKPGVLELQLEIERGSELSISLALHGASFPLQLHLARPLSCCLAHRQAWDKGAAVLAGDDVLRAVRTLSTSMCSSDVFLGRQREEIAYAARWGALVELEAAASAVESNDSRLLFGVYITWKENHEALDMSCRNALVGGRSEERRQGHFDIPVSLARSHRLKFRGLLMRGGECASSWLCLRGEQGSMSEASIWSAHARVIQAGTLEDGDQLAVEDEDLAPDAHGTRSIRVSLELLDESSDVGLPSPDMPILVEYVPKSLSYSCMHMALLDVNPPERADGESQRPLLAREVVLERIKLSTCEDSIDLNAWKLNCSQEQAVRRALARQLMLIHGPPGTGKTRTAAVLMTLFAQRNLGSKCAILFGAPTNRAVDCALHYTNQLCENHFAERLRARVEDDGDEECAICLEQRPDVVTACGHVFHKSCLACSFAESSQCPMCRQVLKQPKGGLRMLRVYGADAERKDFPIPKRHDHQGIQTFKVQVVPDSMRRFSWHWRCHAAVDGEEPSEEALQCRKAYERLRNCSAKDPNFNERRTEYYVALTKARAAEVRQTDIIFSTCVSARRLALQEALVLQDAPEVRQVVMDESGQSPEPEALCLLALPRSAKQAVLFGDHRQLRPILRSQAAERAGLGISLFERLARANEDRDSASTQVALLAQQYRMHPAISKFPREHFYGGRVADHPCVKERGVGILVSPSDQAKDAPLLVWDVCDGLNEEQLQRVRTVGAGGVGSRANIAEAMRTADLAAEIAREAGQEAVAVLSWYNSQVSKISEILNRNGYGKIHVGSIATAQGSEWEYVLLSSVRSGASSGRLGILSDPHTLNVALTRARRGLVILCDSKTLRQDANWSVLLTSCQSRGLVVSERPLVSRGRPQTAAEPFSEQVSLSAHSMPEDFDEAIAWLQRFQGDLVSKRPLAYIPSALPDRFSAARVEKLGSAPGQLERCSDKHSAHPDKGIQCKCCTLAKRGCSTNASGVKRSTSSSIISSPSLHEGPPKCEREQSRSGRRRRSPSADRSCSRVRGKGSIKSRKIKSRSRNISRLTQKHGRRRRSSSDDTGSSIICSFPGYRNKRLKKIKPATCSSSGGNTDSVSSCCRRKRMRKDKEKKQTKKYTIKDKRKKSKSKQRSTRHDYKKKKGNRKAKKGHRKPKKQRGDKERKRLDRATMLVDDSDPAQEQAEEASSEHGHAKRPESLRLAERSDAEDSAEAQSRGDDGNVERVKEMDEDGNEVEECEGTCGLEKGQGKDAAMQPVTQEAEDEESSAHDKPCVDVLRVATDRKASRRAKQRSVEQERDKENATHEEARKLFVEEIEDSANEFIEENDNQEVQQESECMEDDEVVEPEEGKEMHHSPEVELEWAELDDDEPLLGQRYMAARGKTQGTLVRSVFVLSSDESSEETNHKCTALSRVSSRVWVHGGYGESARMAVPHGVAFRKPRAKLMPRAGC